MIELAWNYRSVVAKDINNTEGCGSISKYAPRYFTIDWSKADSNWETVLWFGDVDTPLNQSNAMLCIAASYKLSYGVITSYFAEDKYYDSNLGFSYIPLYVSEALLNRFGIDGKPGVQSFEDIIIYLIKFYLYYLENKSIYLWRVLLK